MRKLQLKLTSVVLCALLVLPSIQTRTYASTSGETTISSISTTSDGYSYTISDQGVTITGYTGTGTDISIPSRIDGQMVTGIGEKAFYFNKNLTSVTIPEGVTSIGDSAFYYCTSLVSILIPDTAVSIGSSAFYNCTSLAGIVMPESLTSIGFGAFENCTALKRVTIPYEVTSISDGAFYNCANMTDVFIGDNVTSIGVSSFANCTQLRGVIIPDSVTSIGSGAFNNCKYLPQVIIPKTVTYIDSGAFSNCSSLSNVYFRGNAPALGSGVFSGCYSYLKIHYIIDKSGFGTTWNGFSTEALGSGFYNVIYSGNGNTSGRSPVDLGVYLPDEIITVSDNTRALTKTGYTFAGWNTKYDGTGTDYAVGDPLNIGEENVTLFAKWIDDTYDFNKDGQVNILDLGQAANCYNSHNTEQKWDSKFDFNSDNIIDIYDLALILKRMH